jgi:hypothetical protein
MIGYAEMPASDLAGIEHFAQKADSNISLQESRIFL